MLLSRVPFTQLLNNCDVGSGSALRGLVLGAPALGGTDGLRNNATVTGCVEVAGVDPGPVVATLVIGIAGIAG